MLYYTTLYQIRVQTGASRDPNPDLRARSDAFARNVEARALGRMP